jgi:hypothetical protein
VAQAFILLSANSRSASCSGRKETGSANAFETLVAGCWLLVLVLVAGAACLALALVLALVLVLEPSFTAAIRYS